MSVSNIFVDPNYFGSYVDIVVKHNKTTYKLRDDITIYSLNTLGDSQVLSQNDVFDGNGHKITIMDINNLNGLFTTSISSSSSCHVCHVKNLHIVCQLDTKLITNMSNQSLVAFFQDNSTNFNIYNCVFTGLISNNINPIDNVSAFCGTGCYNFRIEQCVVNADTNGYNSPMDGYNCSTICGKRCLIGQSEQVHGHISNITINGNISNGANGIIGNCSIKYAHVIINNIIINGGIISMSCGIIGFGSLDIANGDIKCKITNIKINGIITALSGGIVADSVAVGSGQHSLYLTIKYITMHGNITDDSSLIFGIWNGSIFAQCNTYIYVSIGHVYVHGDITNYSGGLSSTITQNNLYGSYGLFYCSDTSTIVLKVKDIHIDGLISGGSSGGFSSYTMTTYGSGKIYANI